MVEFNELRISPDNKCIVIDVTVPDDDYHKNVYLDKIYIQTHEQYGKDATQEKNRVYYWEAPVDNVKTEHGENVYTEEGELVYVLDDVGNIKGVHSARLVLDNTNISAPFDKTMFFVYVVTKGVESMEAPCFCGAGITMRVLVNLYPLYQKSMYYIKELADTCTPPRGFSDYVLKLKALQLAIKTGNNNTAIKLWEKAIANVESPVIKSKCGCNGAAI